MRRNSFAVMAVATLLLGCDASAPTDYLEIAGGGISYNYRYAQATLVLIAKQIKPLPAGALITAKFDQPGSKTVERIETPAIAGKLYYKLESTPVTGIRKGEALKVSLELRDANGLLLDQDETQYTSDVNQADLPTGPLTQVD